MTERILALVAAFGMLAAVGCDGGAAVGSAGGLSPGAQKPGRVECVGVFVEYDAEYTWSAGPPTFELITRPRAGFELSSPAEHTGRIVGILVGGLFERLPGLSAQKDLGKTYHFALPDEFLASERVVINRKEVTNFRAAR